jgi:DNA-binding transcriptional regulator YdaS (Cro superfamily)
MDFKTYYMAMPVSERENFARRCETSPAHLTNIAYGSKTCGESLAINIERESSGIVVCESLRPGVDWAYLRNSTKASRKPKARR